MTILRYLPILLVSATAYAQAGLTWVLSPVNNHIYARTSPMTWQQAEALAVQEGGHLATVRNLQENAWLFQQFGSSSPWIGLSDHLAEGIWRWSSGEPFSFSNWSPGQPDNGGIGEHYAHFFWAGPPSTWNDLCPSSCTNLPGIIELPGGTSAPLTTTSLTTTTPPPALTNHAVSPLPSSGALLFGGTTSTGPNFATYTLAGTTWTAQFPPFSPVTRTGHSLLLDPVRQNNLLFGGLTPGGTPLADTWEWNG